jgi:DNA-binding transcriptional MocR family regulator
MSLPVKEPLKGWVQTDRASHEAWAVLIRRSPLAATLMHLLAARVGDANAVVISQKTLANLAKASRRGVQSALKVLEQDRWIELRQIGASGTVNAHVLNDRVVWAGARDGLRYSTFSAIVVVSDDEQPDRGDLGQQEPLRKVPRQFPGEQQLPAGDGLPPPAEPALPGFEPDLPAIEVPERRSEPTAIGALVGRLVQGHGEPSEE